MSAAAARGTDVLIVCVDTTSGWRTSAGELGQALTRVGARVETVYTGPVSAVRTFMLTDLVQARAARAAARRGIASSNPVAIVYLGITASLLWPRPGAIWLDSIAAENRPGRHGVWQRVVERRRLAAASMVIGMSEGALSPLTARTPDVVVPVPVEPSGPIDGSRDIAAITYAGDPAKRRLALVLDAWSRARRDGEELVVAGIETLPAREAREAREARDGVTVAGRLPPDEYRALLRRARTFVCAPLREDYGSAPLEALADGCQLVTTPARGPYPALGLARRLDPRLVGHDLPRAIRFALDDPAPGYAERAATLLEPFRRDAVDAILKRDVIPRLLPAFSTA